MVDFIFLSRLKPLFDAKLSLSWGTIVRLGFEYLPTLPALLAAITPEGGSLTNGVDTTLSVLPGLLSATATFYSMSLPVNAIPLALDQGLGGLKIIKVREFWRSDTDTPIPIEISVAHTAAEITGIDETSIKIYKWNLYDENNQGKWTQIQDYFVDLDNHLVSFQTQGCSIYVMAGAPINTGFNIFSVVFLAISVIGIGFLVFYTRTRSATRP